MMIHREAIDARVEEMGKTLSADLQHDLEAEGADAFTHPDRIVMVPVMTGAMVFAADLIRHMPLKLSLDLVTVSSYPGQSTLSKGAMMRSAFPDNLNGKHVVIIDDILDSGATLSLVQTLAQEQEPATLRTIVLLDKKARRVVQNVEAEYVGFEIPDEFIVGYGLDYDGYYRNLPDICTLKDLG